MRSVLAAGSLLWVIALLGAPAALGSRHTIASTSAAGVYTAGAFICHQRPERSFHLDGRPLPVCARCTGLYAGAALAAPIALLAASASLAGARARRLALVAALPTAITWTLEVLGIAAFSNATRFAAALPLGFVAAWLVLGIAASTPRRALHEPRLHEPRRQHEDH